MTKHDSKESDMNRIREMLSNARPDQLKRLMDDIRSADTAGTVDA